MSYGEEKDKRLYSQQNFCRAQVWIEYRNFSEFYSRWKYWIFLVTGIVSKKQNDIHIVSSKAPFHNTCRFPKDKCYIRSNLRISGTRSKYLAMHRHYQSLTRRMPNFQKHYWNWKRNLILMNFFIGKATNGLNKIDMK